jgi:GNAT superfamily N-acetyltransferase
MRDYIEIVENTEAKTPVQAFLDEYYAGTTEHPFDRRSRLYGNASLTIYPSPDDPQTTVRLSDIMSLDPFRGHGGLALRVLCDLADEKGVAIELTAKAYGRMEEFMDTRKLVQWYERYGFEIIENYGDDGVDMIRTPR